MSTTFYKTRYNLVLTDTGVLVYAPDYLMGELRVKDEDLCEVLHMLASDEVAAIRFANQMDRKLENGQVISEYGELFNVENGQLYDAKPLDKIGKFLSK